MEKVLFLIKNIESHTTNKGNDCLRVHGFSTSENDSYTLWVFNEDWMEELELREEEYLENEFEVLIDDKTGGRRQHVWAIYFWPTDSALQETWFDSYLKSRGIKPDRPSGEELREKIEKVEEVLNMSFEDELEELEGEKEEKPKLDKDTTIQRQASMHFASRIVAAKIERGVFDVDASDESVFEIEDEKVEEELNKWMTKFQRGITTGKIQ